MSLSSSSRRSQLGDVSLDPKRSSSSRGMGLERPPSPASSSSEAEESRGHVKSNCVTSSHSRLFGGGEISDNATVRGEAPRLETRSESRLEGITEGDSSGSGRSLD